MKVFHPEQVKEKLSDCVVLLSPFLEQAVGGRLITPLSSTDLLQLKITEVQMATSCNGKVISVYHLLHHTLLTPISEIILETSHSIYCS